MVELLVVRMDVMMDGMLVDLLALMLALTTVAQLANKSVDKLAGGLGDRLAVQTVCVSENM